MAATVPAKRVLSAPSKQASKRIRRDGRASLPQMDQRQLPTVSAQQSIAITTEAPVEADGNEVASPPSDVRESSVRPRPRSYSAANGKFISITAILRNNFRVIPKVGHSTSYCLNFVTDYHFIYRATFKAKGRGYLCGKLGLRYRRREST